MNRQERKSFAAMLMDEEAFGSALIVGLVDAFDLEFLEWEPDTLILEIDAHWKVRPPTVNRDKIWSLVTCMTTNLFYQSLETFIATCHALNSHEANFQVFSPATVSEMAWGLAEVALLSPPDNSDKFNTEVPSYMELQLVEEGFRKPPRVLAQYVKMAGDPELNLELDPEGIDYKAYWNDQEYKRMDVDEYVRNRMMGLIQTIGQMDLRHADRAALEALLKRAQTTLARQSQQISSEANNAPKRISL